jgi:hypothetical protein
VSAREARARVAAVVGAVAAQALRERGARRVALLDDGGAEAALAARILEGELGSAGVVRVRGRAGGAPHRAAEERRRYRARLLEDALPAHPASKTALLLGGELPPEPLLPLGDLWASEVLALQGGWSAPPEVAALAAAAGGSEALDDALRRRFDRRDPAGLDALPAAAAAEARRLLAAGAPSRRWPRLVPRLGARTLAADLFE